MAHSDRLFDDSKHFDWKPRPPLTDGDAAYGTTSDSAAGTASAYVLEGPKWASNTVTWSFENANFTQDSADPFSNAIGAAYQSTVQQALARWASVSGVTFVQVPDSAVAGQVADIRIGFADLNTATTYEVGYTSYTYTYGSNGLAVFSPDTLVRLEDPSQDALVQASDGSSVYQGFATNLYQTVLHELGHALGLAHPTDQNAVMFATLGPANTDMDGTDIAGIQALYGAPATTPTTTPVPVTTTQPSPAPTTEPVVTQGGTFGSGDDTLTVSLSEDAYQGDALANITLDGTSLTARPVTVTAPQATGAQEVFTFKGYFGTGNHTVGVDFLNDAWGGTASTDRNLYLDGIALNGSAVSAGSAQSVGGSPHATTAPAAMYQTGDSASFSVSGGTNPPSVESAPAQTDVLTLQLSEDAWNGDAQFVVSIDGHQLGAAQAVTASHSAGAAQTFTFNGTFGLGAHDLAIGFLNDAWGGTPSTDRNLYVLGATYDGQPVPNAALALYTTSTQHVQIPAVSVV